MNFERKFFTPSALISAVFMIAGCAAGTPAVSADEPAAVPAATGETPAPASAPAAVPAVEMPSPVSARVPAELTAAEITDELKRLAEETEKIATEKSLIESRLALSAAEFERQSSALALEKMRLDAARAETSAKLADELADIEEERSELERRLALESARAAAALREKQQRLTALELESRELQAELNAGSMEAKFAVAVTDAKAQLSKLAPDAAQSPRYLKEPLVDGTLYVSDRRVSLNGVITDVLAKNVCERLYFYDNQNSGYPIFIVIDSSPGGSVSAGYQIQRAMRSCKSPVYVVVKNFAASMAAVITTMAERSYCFPNTRILHHQVSSGVQGNLTVMREGVAEGERWYERFASPIAKKMGISLEEFTKQMYAHNSDGDWQETGTRAAELKWVDTVVSRIEETGIISIADPAVAKIPVVPNALAERTDAQGRRFVELPVLENPFDFWAIYDKNNYYRAR